MATRDYTVTGTPSAGTIASRVHAVGTTNDPVGGADMYDLIGGEHAVYVYNRAYSLVIALWP